MTWINLTDEEVEKLWDEAVDLREHFCSQYWDFYKSIEALLKEKNEKNCTGHRDEHGSRYDPFVRNSGH